MNTRHISPKTGQTLIEFALIIPLFILIVMFIFDIGRAVYDYSVLYNAVREGARAAAVGETNVGVLKSLVLERSYGMDLPFSGVDVSWTTQFVTVSAQYAYTPITPLVGRFMPGGNINLRAESSMRLEFSP